MKHVCCPHCKHTLSIPDEYAGQTGTCNKCGAHILVPASGSEAAEIPAEVILAFEANVMISSGDSSPRAYFVVLTSRRLFLLEAARHQSAVEHAVQGSGMDHLAQAMSEHDHCLPLSDVMMHLQGDGSLRIATRELGSFSLKAESVKASDLIKSATASTVIQRG